MINDEFKQVVKSLFEKSFESTLRDANKETAWEFKPNLELPENPNSDELIMLTISAQAFRALIILNFKKDEFSEKFVADVFKIPHAELTKERFYDYLCELGNIFCGMLKRDLGKYIPSLGMSTPNLLDIQALKFIDIERTDLQCHIESRFNNQTFMFGSVFIITYADLDIEVKGHSAAEEEVESGDLEFF